MWLVFLEINPTFKEAFIAAKELGLKILYLSKSKTNLDSVANFADKLLLISDYSETTLAHTITATIPKSQTHGIWTLKDQLIPLTTKVNATIFHHAKSEKQIETAFVTKNKFLLRETLKDTNYNPKYKSINAYTAKTNPFGNETVVIKPPLGHSSIGVEVVKSNEEFLSALQRAQSTLAPLNADTQMQQFEEFDPNASLLIEQFIEGPEYSVEIFASNGQYTCLGICSKSEMKPPYFEEISYLLPAELSKEHAESLRTAAFDIAHRIRLHTGMAHMEFRLSYDGPKILDIGLRLGGAGLTHNLVSIATGVQLVKAVLAEFCNIDPSPYLAQNCEDLALLFLLQVESGGRISELPSFALQGSSAECLKKVYFTKVGDQTKGYPHYSGTPGYALFKISGRGPAQYIEAQEIINQLYLHHKIKYS
jgi:hypothetical protein